jgi:hypothetical protein
MKAVLALPMALLLALSAPALAKNDKGNQGMATATAETFAALQVLLWVRAFPYF